MLHDYDFLNCSAKCLRNLLTNYLISKYDKLINEQYIQPKELDDYI